jgi:PKD repeat protein/photosystem II stability/assembly factor-like uncharacterized protein
MNARLLTLIISLCILTSISGFAQKYLQMMNDPEINFYDVKKEAEAYFSKVGKEEGSGYEFYKRWEYINEQRFAPSGNRLIADKGKQLHVKTVSVFDSASVSANWSCLGPINGNIFWGAGRVNYMAIDPSDQRIIWSAAATGGIWKSTDSAKTWKPVSDFIQNLGASAIAIDPKNTSIVYVGTGDYDGGSSNSFGLIKTTDGGLTWNNTGLQFDYVTDGWPKISDVNINPDSTNQILVSSTKGLYISKDSGATWNRILTSEVREIRRNPGNSEIVYIATGNHKIYKSTDGGESWSLSMTGIGTGGSLLLIAVTTAAPDNLYVANLSSNKAEGFYVSTDQGTTFMKESSAIGVADLVQLGYNDCLAVSSVDPNIVIIGAVHLGRSLDGGATWKQISQWDDPHCDHHFLLFDSTGVLYNANDGGVWKSPDNGVKWSRCNGTFTAEQYYNMGENRYSPDVFVAGSQDNGFHYMNKTYWGQGNGGDAMDCIVDYNDPKKMVGLGYLGGSVLTSTSGGTVWKVNSADNMGLPVDAGNWVTPIVIDPILPNTYYLGLEELWKSTDFCVKWRKLTNKLTVGIKITAIDVFSRNSNIIYFAANSKLFKTINGGVTWSGNIASGMNSGETITWIAISQNNPNEVWVTKSAFNAANKVFHTLNGGTDWENITYNLPNLPFNTVVAQNDTANGVYAGSDEDVYYINKNMTEWVPFNQNLPRAIVRELNFYAPKGTVRACTYGRGVWETSAVESQPANIIPSGGLKIYYADGYSNTDQATASLFDNNPLTVLTSPSDTIHELRIDLQKSFWIDGFVYVPDTSLNKNIADYSIYISNDSSIWKRLVNTGKLNNDKTTKNLAIYPTEGRYIKLIASPVLENDVISIADIKISGIEAVHPIANFDLSDTTKTIGGVVDFADKSTNSPTQWLWEFGDGGASSLQNPTHTYSRKGKYTVTLTASNELGMDAIRKATGIYPNPAREYFTIDCSSLNVDAISSINIYDLKGAIVYSHAYTNDLTVRINSDEVRKYGNSFIVKVKAGNEVYSGKLILMQYKMKPKKDKK